MRTLRLRHIRLPLLGKMLILLLLAAIVPLIVVGTMSIHRGVDAVRQTAEQNLQLVALTAGARLDQVFSQTQRLQRIVATTETVVKACSASPAQRNDLLITAEQWLKDMLSCDPDLALAYLADEQGVCLISTSPNMVGRDYKATRDYMRQALQDETVIPILPWVLQHANLAFSLRVQSKTKMANLRALLCSSLKVK